MRRSRPQGAAIPEIGETYPKEMVTAQWSEFSRRLHTDLDAVSHSHKLRYEDLMETPRETLEAIFGFLDMSVPKIEIEGEMVQVNGRKFHFSNQNDASISRLSDADRTVLETAMSDELKRNGYVGEGVSDDR